jgi:hypothetical protein
MPSLPIVEHFQLYYEDLSGAPGCLFRCKRTHQRARVFLGGTSDSHPGQWGTDSRRWPTNGPLFRPHRKAHAPQRSDLTVQGYARLSYRQADTLWKLYTPGWTLQQFRHTAISVRANAYTDVDLKCFSGHRSPHSLERYSAENRKAAKRKDPRVGAPRQASTDSAPRDNLGRSHSYP